MNERPPANAWPPSVFAAQERIDPNTIRCEIAGDHLYLWIGGLSISVNRHADDTALAAAEHIGGLIQQAAGRFASHLAALRADREAHRVAEQAAAAHRATEHTHPYPPVEHGGCGDTAVLPVPPA